MIKTVQNSWLRWIVLVAICVSLTAVGMKGMGFGTIRQALARQPEHFTELFFSQYTLLPKQNITQGQTYEFDITIVNHDRDDLPYRYLFEVTENGTVSRQTFTTDASNVGQTIIKRLKFTPREATGALSVVVRLVDQNQEIHFKART